MRRARRLGLIAALALLAGLIPDASARADDPAFPPGLVPAERARVVSVIDGATLALEGGTRLRLVGIQAPFLPRRDGAAPAWPLAHEARAALETLALGHVVTLHDGGRRRDRHGRRLAHAVRDDGLWLQGRLLALGHARVLSSADNRAGVAAMLALEDRARAERRGIWAAPFYRVLAAGETGTALRSVQLVEGRVRRAAVVRGRAYLNFGADWRTDFTVTMAPAVRRLFEAEGASIESYEGRLVRVRGWIKSFNGPMIDATHPEQIEVLN